MLALRRRRWTPQRLVGNGLRAWYDATQIPSLVDGDPVSTWSDLSGGALHATQTGSNRPIYKTGIINGKSIVRFTAASSQNLVVAATSDLTAFSVMAVALYNSTPSGVNYSILTKGIASVGAEYNLLIQNATGKAMCYIFDGSTQQTKTSTNAVAAAAFHMLEVTAAGGTGGAITFYKEGATNGTSTVNAGLDNNESLYIGGANDTSTSYWDGDIGEIVVGSRVWTTIERRYIKSYVKAKWNLAVV